MNTPRRKMCLWVPLMALVLGLWVAGCSTPATNQASSDDFGAGNSFAGTHSHPGSSGPHSHPGSSGPHSHPGASDPHSHPGTPGTHSHPGGSSPHSHPGNGDFAEGSFDILEQLGNSGNTDAPGQIVIVDEQPEGAVTGNGSWSDTDSRHADGGTIGAHEEIVIVSPKLEGAFLGQGFLSMTDVGDDGEAMNIFITQLPSDVSVEHVPDRFIVFADDSSVSAKDPSHMIVADARNGQNSNYQGNTWGSEVVSPEPTISVNDNIYFAFNSWKLRDSMVDTLVASAKWLKAHEGTKVMIEGHCDERGSREYNVVLGEKRASVVKSFLRDLGVRASQIVTLSYGKERPVCLEGSKTCHSKNRRAFIHEM